MKAALAGVLIALCVALIIAFSLLSFKAWRNCKNSGGEYVQGVSLSGYVCIK